MPLTQPLVTNREGAVVLEELSILSDSTPEQYVAESILSLLICVNAIRNNRREGKLSPTLILFEQENGGYLAYDFLDTINNPHEPTPSPKDPSLKLTDPFRDGKQVELPLSPETRKDLDDISDYLSIPPTSAVEEAINLRYRIQQAFSRSLNVLIEGHIPDEYYEMPVEFGD